MTLPAYGRAWRGTALASLFVLAACPARAQSFDGEWTASFTSGAGNPREVDVRIAGRAGTWALRPRPNKDKKDPCVGRPFPLVLSEGAGGTVLRVEASAVVSGCDDRTVTLQAVDARTLSGQFSNGTAVMFVRR